MTRLCLATGDMQWNKALVGMFMEDQYRTRVRSIIWLWVLLGFILAPQPAIFVPLDNSLRLPMFLLTGFHSRLQ